MVFIFFRRVPNDLKDIYISDRISMSLKTKSIMSERRVAKSINQRLEDYLMGIRFQKINIPAIQFFNQDKLPLITTLLYVKLLDYTLT